jgi:hypothetical protein
VVDISKGWYQQGISAVKQGIAAARGLASTMDGISKG